MLHRTFRATLYQVRNCSSGYGLRILLSKYDVACIGIGCKVTGTASSASSARSKPVGLKYIFQLGIPAVFIFLILSLPFPMTNDFGNLFLFAGGQSSLSNVQDEQNTNEAIQTFQIDGAIGSLVSDLLNPTITGEENVTARYHQFTCL
jgi:hypothetical protein